MKRKLRILCVFIAIFMLVGIFSACESTATPQNSTAASVEANPATAGTVTTASTATESTPAADVSANTVTQKTQFKVGFISWLNGHSVPAAWNKGIENEVKDFPNIQYQEFDGEQSSENQISILRNLVNQKYDAVIIQAGDTTSMGPAIEEARKAGVFIITLNLTVDTTVSADIEMAHYQTAVLVASEMAKELNQQGKIVILQGAPGASAAIDREKGFRDELAKYPNMEIIEAQTAQWMKDEAITVMNTFLQKYDKIDGVFGMNDSMAEGAALAAEAAGRLNGMVIWGDDGEKDALTMVEQGKLTGTIYTNCFEQGALALRVAEYLVTSGLNPLDIPNTGRILMAPLVVTKDNVASIPAANRW